MPTKKYFSQCPEFPSDVNVLNIPTISFSRLQNDAEHEGEKLYNACTEHGIFALDLRDSEEGGKLLKQAERFFDIGADTFDLGTDVLDKYAYQPPSLLGYKATGKLKTDDGKRDIMEMYTIGQDDILGTGARRENPEPIEACREDCQDFFRQAHKALCVVYSHLDKKLALAPNTLAALSPLDKPSDTSLRLLMSRPQPVIESDRVTLTGHTDIGTITMLFHVTGGLQILPAGCENISSNWRYIRPRPDCVVINLGDTLVEWTGGVLRSSLHRVLTAPGEQASIPRQSLAYLVRPDHNATMRRLKSNGVIPPASEGEEEDTRSVDDWAAGRVKSIILGEVKPQGRGGRAALADIPYSAVKKTAGKVALTLTRSLSPCTVPPQADNFLVFRADGDGKRHKTLIQYKLILGRQGALMHVLEMKPTARESIKRMSPQLWTIGSSMMCSKVKTQDAQPLESIVSWHEGSSTFHLLPRDESVLKNLGEGDSVIDRIHESGTGSGVWGIGDEFIFKAKGWKEDRQLEAVTMNFVAENFPSVPVPEVLYSWIDQALDRTFLITKRVHARTLNNAWSQLSPAQRQGIANEMADHCFTITGKTSSKLETVSGRGVLDYFLMGKPPFSNPTWLPMILGPFTCAELRTYMSKISDQPVPQFGDTLLFYHSDLGPTNILVSDDGNSVAAIIDWEAAAYYPDFWVATRPVGNPAYRLSEPTVDPLELYGWNKIFSAALVTKGFSCQNDVFQKWRKAVTGPALNTPRE
ncbi:hypothetical protein G7Y89_g11868 [Cudoniella acicularis]|uniref:Fe2OG dioxygenase domain-containing protein n=1 Tax=Cudoniella acicularis TaxID=354080 RepID=A0A8H4W085_9HELO|nr:hypothetical protein G7Y89_g11868 [Cudoniella acicularis]